MKIPSVPSEGAISFVSQRVTAGRSGNGVDSIDRGTAQTTAAARMLSSAVIPRSRGQESCAIEILRTRHIEDLSASLAVLRPIALMAGETMLLHEAA